MKPLKHHVVFLSMIAISGFIWLQMAVYLGHELFGYNPDWGFIQYCLSLLKERTVWHEIVFIGLNVLIGYSYGMVLLEIARQWVHAKRWYRYVMIHRNERMTEKVNRCYPHFRNKIIVINQDSAVALTYGFLRPMIVVSSKTVEQFSEGELAAILWHEWCHCRHYDPLRLLLVKMMKNSLPFIPILNRPASYIHVVMELQADRYSIKRMNSPFYLANVLLKWSRMPNSAQIGIGFADNAINYRLMQLMEPGQKIQFPIWGTSPFLSSALMVVFITGIVTSGCS
ncbi:M56 family metallopeptidase [Cohnella algarum]|uniref:M56 family metallopeptidase n=1 Tax=Cohnella algarum TaxID=2044859 RepID=UPI00196768FA|nr:M56 family metallopeptidase [Cohnella algarum]MBN2981789.1 M56 family metallopeptidase [Cohnella algarum]